MLPTCPACKQSVLDDDATECPFCGANMKTGKGGGSTKPPAAASKPAAAAASSAKSSPAKPASKPASPSRKSSLDDDDDPFSEGDDDPFAAAMKQDAASKANAIAVSVKKTKTNVVELKCPMCDTVGFVPENSGGKDIKCANPKCTVPVFMAPKKFGAPAPVVAASKSKTKAAANPNSKKPLILAIVGGVALVAVVALAVWFWPDSSSNADNGPDFKKLAEEARRKREAEGIPEPGPKVVDNANGKPGDPMPPENGINTPSASTLDVPRILKLIDDYSAEEQLANKKYCRLRSAIAFAVVGDEEGMRGQFQKLDIIDAGLPHFKIPAQLALAWRQLAAGNKAGAAKLADEALAAAPNVGKGSRDTQEAVIDLAALLVAIGKTDTARDLLSKHFTADASTPLVVATGFARHRRTFDLDQEVPGTIGNPHRAWSVVGVTLVLNSEGFNAEARNWAQAVPDVEARTDALIAWADSRLRIDHAQSKTPGPELEGVGDKLSPAGKVQLLARLARTWSTLGNATEAQRLVTAAQAALKAIPVPAAARVEGFKDALDWKAPEAVALRQAVVAAAALGQAQARMKKIDDGWISIIKALKYARAIAPSPAAVGAVTSLANELGPAGLRDKLRMLLVLPSQDEATRKARDLKNKLELMESLAGNRFRLQEAVLKDAVAVGLAPQIWIEARSLAERNDPNEIERYLEGTLPLHLIQEFTAQGLTKDAAEVQAKIEGVELPPDEVLELQPQVAAAIKNGNLGTAITAFNQRKLAGATEELALRGISQAAKQPGQTIPILKAAMAIETRQYNLFVKLEALRVLAAYAARQGNAQAVFDAIQNQKMASVERVSVYLGLLEGHAAWQKAQPVPKAEPANSEKKPSK